MAKGDKKETPTMNIPLICKKDEKYFSLEIGNEVEVLPPFFHILGQGGAYFQNVNGGHDIIRKVEDDELVHFDEIEEHAEFHYPVIPFEIYIASLSFLRKVFTEHKSEGAVLLLLNSSRPLKDQQYEMYIPEQEVASAGVDYKIEEGTLTDGKFLAGSIHSHPDFSAYQSGVDHADEFNSDGIHITLGQIMKVVPEMHQRVCLAGTVYEHKNPLIHMHPEGFSTIPDEWMKKVTKKTYVTRYPNQHPNVTGYGGTPETDSEYQRTFWDRIRGVPVNNKSDKSLTIIAGEECKILS